MRLAAAIVVLAALAAPVHADDDDEERARAHYEIGLGLYRLGKYEEALREFADGYELARKPGFLLNLGQTYRKLGELREARQMYRRFLAEVRPGDPARPQAERVLAEIEQALRTAPPSRPAPPTPPPDVAPPATSASPAPIASPAPSAPSTSAHAIGRPRPPRRALRIAGIAVGAGGVTLLGGGIGAAVVADGTARDLNGIDRAGGVFDATKDSAYSRDRALEAAFLASGAALAATGVVLLVVGSR
jgi:tetratricopeptide (TPR) repeat protein